MFHDGGIHDAETEVLSKHALVLSYPGNSLRGGGGGSFPASVFSIQPPHDINSLPRKFPHVLSRMYRIQFSRKGTLILQLILKEF